MLVEGRQAPLAQQLIGAISDCRGVGGLVFRNRGLGIFGGLHHDGVTFGSGYDGVDLAGIIFPDGSVERILGALLPAFPRGNNLIAHAGQAPSQDSVVFGVQVLQGLFRIMVAILVMAVLALSRASLMAVRSSAVNLLGSTCDWMISVAFPQ